MYRALAYGLVGVVAVATGESQGIVLQTAALGVDAPVALDAGLQGVALQLKELEAMKERGTLDDMTFAHAVHEATVLNPLVSSLSAMGVLHDKGQLSDEELAFTKSVAFSRFDQTASGNLIVPPVSMGNPSPTGEATVSLKTAEDKETEAEERARAKEEATRLALLQAKREEEAAAAQAEEAARVEEEIRLAAEAAAKRAAAAKAAEAAEAAEAEAKAERLEAERLEAERLEAERLEGCHRS